MPVRVLIHSSLVSCTDSKSKLVIVVDGEADPMPMGRTERGPPAAIVRDVFVGLLGGDKKAEQVEDRRSDGRKSLMMNEIGGVCV